MPALLTLSRELLKLFFRKKQGLRVFLKINSHPLTWLTCPCDLLRIWDVVALLLLSLVCDISLSSLFSSVEIRTQLRCFPLCEAFLVVSLSQRYLIIP